MPIELYAHKVTHAHALAHARAHTHTHTCSVFSGSLMVTGMEIRVRSLPILRVSREIRFVSLTVIGAGSLSLRPVLQFSVNVSVTRSSITEHRNNTMRRLTVKKSQRVGRPVCQGAFTLMRRRRYG